jgi:sporulation protein YlmC with PRC-barrel domain
MASEQKNTASAIEDVNSLPGETVCDQDGRRIGKVREIYAIGEGKDPMWVTVETSTGLGRSRLVFVPISRLKHEQDEIRVPYSFQHIQSAPEIEPGEELAEGDDRALRDYYAIDLGDQEIRSDNESYASLVPDGEEPAKKVEGEAGKPQSGKIEGEGRDVELRKIERQDSTGEGGTIQDPRDQDGDA